MAAIEPHRDERFIEIGPGPGALTLRLAARAGEVTAIELDQAMVEGWPKLPANVTLVHADFLDVDIASMTSAQPSRVVGNLPYNVSSPILFRLLEVYRTTGALVDATLMLQREVANRITAAPGTGEDGVLSISVQMHADVRRVLALPPGAFRPPPRVHSAVVHFRFRPPAVALADHRVFEAMVRSIFTQRRKTLQNALGPFASSHQRDAGAALGSVGIDSAPARDAATNRAGAAGIFRFSRRTSCAIVCAFLHTRAKGEVCLAQMNPGLGSQLRPVDTGRGALPLHDALHPPGWCSQRGLSLNEELRLVFVFQLPPTLLITGTGSPSSGRREANERASEPTRTERADEAAREERVGESEGRSPSE